MPRFSSLSRSILLISLLSLWAVAPAGAAPAPPWPGLPSDTVTEGAGGWLGTQATGINEVVRAEQWARIPLQASLAVIGTVTTRYYPADDPESRLSDSTIWAAVFWSSPRDAAHGYGESLPFTVRTVAFGAIPVEATVQVSQARDRAGLPIPFATKFTYTSYQDHRLHYAPTDLSGRVALHVRRLVVDGVPLSLRSTCETDPTSIRMHSPGGWAPPQPSGNSPSEWKAYADGLAERGLFTDGGGRIDGTIDIPAFAGCRTTTGEDLSRLLTASISGKGNPVSISTPTTSVRSCWTVVPPLGLVAPRGPFQGDPGQNCNATMTPWRIPFPARD